jgi:hypothetical protein
MYRVGSSLEFPGSAIVLLHSSGGAAVQPLIVGVLGNASGVRLRLAELHEIGSM